MTAYRPMAAVVDIERLVLRPRRVTTLEEPEIAYELFGHAHGQGYATEAAAAVLDAAAATGRRRMWSTVCTWNAASLRVLDKLGFERHPVTEDDRGELIWLTRSLPGPDEP